MIIFGKKGNATIFIQNENPHLNKIAEGLNCIRYGQTSGLDVSGAVLLVPRSCILSGRLEVRYTR